MTNIQQLLDDAADRKLDAILPAGDHYINVPLVSRVMVRRDGPCKLIWAGSEIDEPMLTIEGNWDYLQGIEGIDFACRDKAAGIKFINVHRTVVNDVQVMQAKGIGIQAERAWSLHIRNVTVGYSKNSQAMVTTALSQGSINGLYILKMAADGPMVETSGNLPIWSVNVEHCDCGENPVVALGPMTCGNVGSFHFERNVGTSAAKLADSKHTRFWGLSVWQIREAHCFNAVEVVNSENCRIGGISVNWAPGRTVLLDHESYRQGCRVE